MQNTSGEVSVVKSLATTIHKRLVSPAEEQFRELDSRINDQLVGSREIHAVLQEEINELAVSALATKEELNKLIVVHKNTRMLVFIALTLIIINIITFAVK